jgi:hypothetical protein
MDDALLLARLRAGGPAVVADVDTASAAADRAGRRIVVVQPDRGGVIVALGWPDDAEVSPETWPIATRELAPTTLLALAACLGCCWRDPTADPHPGAVVAVSEVLDTLRTTGLDERWAKGALAELEGLGFVEVRGTELRLGAAVAALPRSEIALLQRGHHALPQPTIPEVPR